MLKIYNSLTNKTENFNPINNKNIKIYSCGLTVYDKAHLGHARTTVAVDILVRLLKYLYKNVIYVRNITDVDDKINIRATQRSITIQELTKEIINYCDSDMKYLNNLTPTFEPKVTENISEIIDIIQKLIDNGFAYVASGNVFFDVNKYKDYGKLSNRNIEELKKEARIEAGEYKKNALDFVLWKPSLAIDDESSKFESPWGVGRPGWHIECSALSHKYLGENFDIHCGGVDLKFPHHENEIAQSCCAFLGSNFANYWFHTGFLMVNGEKMSKSLNNFITIEKLKNEGVNGKIVRFAMMKNHYRKPLDFNENLIKESEKNLKDLHKNVINFECENKVPDEVIEILCNDVNTPKVIALLNDFNNNKNYDKLKNALEFLGIFDENLLKIDKDLSNLDITEEEINDLIKKRNDAKKNKDWIEADKIRDYLKLKNILLKDSKNGVEWDIIK